MNLGSIIVEDPTGGIRNVIPGNGKYKNLVTENPKTY